METVLETGTLQIESLGAHGDGIARLPDGRRVFVPGALPGENVTATPGAEQGGDIAANLDSVLKPSPDRIAPACRHFGTCGGCVLQHASPALYNAFKMEQVHAALARHNITPAAIEGPFTSPPGTRRRATFAAYHGAGHKMVVGFNERRSNKIVDQGECPVLSPRLQALVAPLRRALPGILQEGQGMDIAVTESGGAVDMLLRPWVRRKKGTAPDIPRHIVERLAVLAEESDSARLSWQADAGDAADILPVLQRHPFTVDFSGTAITPPPGAFLQATAEGEQALIACILGGLGKKTRKIADLYAGCGTFTFALAAQGYKLHAAEGFAPALNALKGAIAGKPITAERRDLAREPLVPKELNGFDAILLDPPRPGALEQIKMIARSTVKTVAYVSCNPASFARDAQILTERGFKLENLRVVDQFLWSPHIELAGIFRR